jgi:uncharacterized cupin superfamily protein
MNIQIASISEPRSKASPRLRTTGCWPAVHATPWRTHASDASQRSFIAGAGRAHPESGASAIPESGSFCLTEGRVALENLEGERWEFGRGEGFVVPAGFDGTWQVIEHCTKFYAIFEART